MRLWIGNPKVFKEMHISEFKQGFTKGTGWYNADCEDGVIGVCENIMERILLDSGEEPLQPGELREIESIIIKLKKK